MRIASYVFLAATAAFIFAAVWSDYHWQSGLSALITFILAALFGGAADERDRRARHAPRPTRRT